MSAGQQQFVRSELVITRHREFSQGIGESKGGIKCIYSPSLADLCQDCFAACVIDEGTKIKGDHTIIGTGVRQINAEFRLVLTATPIKNRFPDLFHLAHYVSGGHEEPTARFPYGKVDKQDFAEEFLVSERNLTKEQMNDGQRGTRRFVKFTPQVCNVHRAWKLLAPIILRRRKDDCGEDIVPKLRHVVRVPMGPCTIKSPLVVNGVSSSRWISGGNSPAFVMERLIARAACGSDWINDFSKERRWRAAVSPSATMADRT